MKRSLLLLIPFSSLLNAQPNEVHETYITYRVGSVTQFEIIDGNKFLLDRKTYNEDGINTSRYAQLNSGALKVTINDTFIIHSKTAYTEICRIHNEIYDSMRFEITSDVISDTLTKEYFKNGKVVLRTVYVEDLSTQKMYTETPGKKYKANIHTWTEEYDSLKRVVAHHESDTTAVGSKRSFKHAYGHTIEYGDSFNTYRHYWIDRDGKYLTHITYSGTELDYDSTVSYDRSGNIESFYTIYRDERGDDTLSVGRDKTGKVTNRNRTEVKRYSEKTEHADGEDFVFKTVEVVYDENDLIIKRIETDHRTNETRTFAFEYTYY